MCVRACARDVALIVIVICSNRSTTSSYINTVTVLKVYKSNMQR